MNKLFKVMGASKGPVSTEIVGKKGKYALNPAEAPKLNQVFKNKDGEANPKRRGGPTSLLDSVGGCDAAGLRGCTKDVSGVSMQLLYRIDQNAGDLMSG